MTALAPIHCDGCGASIPLRSPGERCGYCGAAVTVPPAYLEALALLGEQDAARRRVEPHLRRLQRPPGKRWIFVGAGLVALLPPFAVAGVVALAEVALSQADYISLAALPALAPGAVIAFAALASRVTSMQVMTAMAARLVEGEPCCRTCGAPLAIEPEALAASCGYCGSDSILCVPRLEGAASRLRGNVATLREALARLGVRRRLSWLAATAVFGSLAALGWLVRWAFG